MTAVDAGRKNASAVPNSASITTTCQIATSPVRISAASAAWRTKRTRSVTTISRCRGTRSAQIPPISMNATSGIAWAARTMPRSVALPVRSITNSASATVTIRSPSTLASPASQSSRKSRCRSTENSPAIRLIVSTDRGAGSSGGAFTGCAESGRGSRGLPPAGLTGSEDAARRRQARHHRRLRGRPDHARSALREPRGRPLRAAAAPERPRTRCASAATGRRTCC